MGDTDSITDVFVSAGRAAVNIDYIKDCPAGITDCWIEIQFVSRCPEVWCSWTGQRWKKKVAARGSRRLDDRVLTVNP
jgi:hypothetical protein